METRSERLRRGAAAALVLALAACGSPTIEDEEAIGREAVAQIRQHVVVLHDDVVNAYIDDIGQRLVQASGPQPFEYTFTVIEDDELNAFATFGGNIFVHTGLILRVRNVGELSGVLGHEIGHVVKRHMADNYARAKQAGWLRNAAVIGSAIGGVNPGAVDLLTQFGAIGILNTFTREAESEADTFAVDLLPRAGYDPNGIVTMFEVLTANSVGRSRAPKFFQSHPASEERTKATKALIAAKTLPANLKNDDNGKLEIIQHRVRLLTRQKDPAPKRS
ncbi:MAG TPA: M48 family metallopeptidase [Myxococcota bacterium]|nr:M48 family metallopeptidase [Myxococcota bacterium]